MPVPASVLAELRRHVPSVDGDMRLTACTCGWRLQEGSDDLWLSWLFHLPCCAAPGKLVLSEDDARFLHAYHIKI